MLTQLFNTLKQLKLTIDTMCHDFAHVAINHPCMELIKKKITQTMNESMK